MIIRLSYAEITENHLATVHAFLSCFDHLHSHAELEEYASEVLFRLLRHHPEISVTMLDENKELPFDAIIEFLASPVNDVIDLEGVYSSIAAVSGHETTKQLIMDALKEAMDRLK